MSNTTNSSISSTLVDYSTLIVILSETLSAVFNPVNLYYNIHVYTDAISKLRYRFLEPLVGQVLINNVSIVSALKTVNKGLGDLSLSQKVYISKNINNNLNNLLTTIGTANIPSAQSKNQPLYSAAKLMNTAIHKGQNTKSRIEFINAFFECASVYRSIFISEVLTPYFKNEGEVEAYFANKFDDYLKSTSNAIILESFNELKIHNNVLNNELNKNIQKINEYTTLIQNLTENNNKIELHLNSLQNSIRNYINLKEIWDKKLDEEYIKPLIDNTILKKVDAWKEYYDFKDERTKLNEQLKLLI